MRVLLFFIHSAHHWKFEIKEFMLMKGSKSKPKNTESEKGDSFSAENYRFFSSLSRESFIKLNKSFLESPDKDAITNQV